MKTSSIKNQKIIFISLLVLIGIWILLSNKINNSIYLPKVSEILKEIFKIVKEKYFLLNICNSLLRGFISFIMALVIAIILGIISGFNKFIYNFLYPINSILKSIPTIAFILIALIWLNKNYAPYLIGFIMAFPVLYECTINSIINENKDLIEMAETFRVKFIYKLLNIYIPKIIINISSIATSTFSLVLKVVIAGEVYGQPLYGIGTAIQGEKINFNTAGIFAWIVIVAILCYITDKVIIYVLNKSIKGRRYILD